MIVERIPLRDVNADGLYEWARKVLPGMPVLSARGHICYKVENGTVLGDSEVAFYNTYTGRCEHYSHLFTTED